MKLRKLGPAFALVAIVAGGVVWSGCGDGGNDTGTVGDQVQREVEKGKTEAESKVDDARKKAEKGIDEGKAEAEKGIEEAQEQAEKYLP